MITQTDHKIGFIGVGAMGKPMALNLMRKGYKLLIYDISADAVRQVCEAGAEAAPGIAEIAETCRIMITMLPNSPHVKQVLLGADGVLAHAPAGAVIIDMSSISPVASRELAAEAARKGCEYLEAPVSGGRAKAVDGTLSIMVGGDRKVFESVREILLCMGASAVYVGGPGSGNFTKLANQIIVMLNIAAMSEAMTLASKAGVDPAGVYEAIRGGLAGSAVLDAKMPLVLKRDFSGSGRIDLNIKDLLNAAEAAQEYGVAIPLTRLVLDMLNTLKAAGLASEDHAALIKYYERLSATEVK